MSGILRSVLSFVRLILISIFLFVNWPAISALASSEITWGEAVTSLLSSWGVLILSIISILTLAISFFKIRIIALIVNGITLLILAGLFTGFISGDQLRDTVSSYDINKVIKPCGWSTVLEAHGDGIRKVLKNESGETIGYVSPDDGYNGSRDKVVDLSGKALICEE